MTTVEILEVIYENGVLKPLERHGFEEHQRYRVIVEPLASRDDDDPFEQAIEEARRERQAHFEAELDEFFPCDKDNE